MCMLDLYGSYLLSSDLQHGFKKNSSCSSAIYTVRSVIEYFTKHGSTVNVCLLDMSKAFDKVNHHGLSFSPESQRSPLPLTAHRLSKNSQVQQIKNCRCTRLLKSSSA